MATAQAGPANDGDTQDAQPQTEPQPQPQPQPSPAPQAQAQDGKAFYGYLFDDHKPIPQPKPLLDALLRALAIHIVRYKFPSGH